jgi:AbrB family looped-hinge helix DNA binding protein
MEGNMKAVTVSPKYRIVIPRDVRKSMNIKPGAKIKVIRYENRLELIPIRDPNTTVS